LKGVKGTYLLFYLSFLIVVLVAVFCEMLHLVYVKPLVPISLGVIGLMYLQRSLRFYFTLSMLTIMVNDTLVYWDFGKYFNQVAITIIIFYFFCLLLLKNYISLKDINLKKFLSFPIMISVILIGYLTFEISVLVLPNLQDSIVAFFLILIVLFFFVGTCFFIYIIDEFQGNFRLFITASCCLFVTALLLINNFYYYDRIFTVLINIAEVIGLYFFVNFFLYAKPIDSEHKEENYF